MPKIKNSKIPVNATNCTPHHIARPKPQIIPTMITPIPAIPITTWPVTGLSYR